MGSVMRDYKFNSVYEFVNIINEAVDGGFELWNFNGELFVQSALKFNKLSCSISILTLSINLVKNLKL